MVNTRNGRPADFPEPPVDFPEPRTLARPAAEPNPYLVQSQPSLPVAPLTLVTPPGVPAKLTRAERQVFLKGREQLLEMYLTGTEGRYAQRQIAQLEVEVGDLFHYLGDRVWEHTLAGRAYRDEWLQAQFELFSQAQVIRSGKAMAQIADTTERHLHRILDEAIAPEEEGNFMTKLLGLVGGRRER